MGLMGFISVGLGAAIGAWLRWWMGLSLNAILPFLPLGTLAANLIGGYVMGLAVGAFAIYATLPSELRLFVTTGFLGGLTTFSTFSAEAVNLISRGQYAWAAMHILTHVVGSLLMTGLGIYTVHLLKA